MMMMMIYIDWVRECQAVNLVYYKNDFKNLREHVRRRRPDLWKNASWNLHHDNALSVKRYLAKNNIPVMEHHRATSFSSRKSSLRSTDPRFETVYTVKAKATELRHTIRL